MAAYDTESTGPIPERDLLVTACVSWVDGSGGAKPVTRTWLADPGIDIPAGATAVHGITTDHARKEGASPAFVVGEIAEELLRKRTLGVIAEHYGVRAGKAHDAAGDALTAARVAYAIGQRYPRIANMPLADLHAFQADAKHKQAVSLAEHFARTGKPEPVDGSWPWKPWTGDDS
jgi:DNA polymerase III subunit epsilon